MVNPCPGVIARLILNEVKDNLANYTLSLRGALATKQSR